MAGPEACTLLPLASVVAGTMLSSMSANTWNQMMETAHDSKMVRTRARPMPSGRLTRGQAAAFGVGAGAAGVGILAAGCNPLTAALGAGNIALYSLVYTPSKRVTPFNTVIGSVVGAIPPVMGWVAAGGQLDDPAAAILFSTLFLWQMPHFYALAWRHRQDYSGAGYRMISHGDTTGGATAGRILAYSGLMAALPIASWATGVTSPMFAIEGIALNAYFLPLAWRFWRDRSDESARKVFLSSLWYLPLLMALMCFHATAWEAKDEEPEGEALSDPANLPNAAKCPIPRTHPPPAPTPSGLQHTSAGPLEEAWSSATHSMSSAMTAARLYLRKAWCFHHRAAVEPADQNQPAAGQSRSASAWQEAGDRPASGGAAPEQ